MDDKNPEEQPKEVDKKEHSDQRSEAQLEEIITRLSYLENAVRAQLSRLYEIEQRLGFTPTIFQTPPQRPQGPPQPPQKTAAPPPHFEPQQRRPLERPLPPTPRPGQPPFNQPPVTPPFTSIGREETGRPQETPQSTGGKPMPAPPAGPGASQGTAGTAASSMPPPKPPSTPPVDASRPAPFPSQPHRQQSRSTAQNPTSLEFRIGGNWLAYIGVTIFVLAVGFFLKLAFDQGWITPVYRIVGGLLLGIAFLSGGEYLRKKYAAYAYSLSGGGILVLYLTSWASFRLYEKVPQQGAFIFMAVVTALAALLAARYNALTIAILGLFGGFLTPILLSTGVDNQTGLFTYIVLLDLGVLALAVRKQWRVLNYLTFAATVLMSAGWYDRWYEPAKLMTTVLFFTILFIIFALVSILHNIINHRPTIWADLIMVFVNALLYFGSSYALLSDVKQSGKYQGYLGLFAVLMSLFYGGLGLFTYKRDREDRLLLLTFSGLAFLFLVLAAPIQFDQQWVTMAWAIEGAVMTWVGLRAKDRTSLYAALVVFAIAAYHWFVIDAMEFGYQAGVSFTPIFNPRALSCAVLVASLFAASFFYKRLGEHLSEEERSMFGSTLLLGANVFAITLLSMDVNSYFEQRKAAPDVALSDDLRRLNNSYIFTLSALWSLYGAIAMFIGVVRKVVVVRAVALVLLAITAFKVLAFDLWYLNETWQPTIFNQTFISFAFVVGALSFSAWLYSRSQSIGRAERDIIVPLLISVANLFALIGLSAEVIGYYNRVAATPGLATYPSGSLEERKQFLLSVVWIIYGAVALFVGARRQRKAVRAAALGLLGAAAVKNLVVNLAFVTAKWHTTFFNFTFASFALLILALAFAVWLYSRSEDIGQTEKAGVIPVLVGAANFFAVGAISAEIVTHFLRLVLADQSLTVVSSGPLFDTMLFALSVFWSLYAAVALAIGIRRNSTVLRFGALLLLILAIGKLIFLDLRFYDAAWHRIIINQTFGSFAIVIAALSAAIWFYSKSEEIEAEESFGIIPTLIIVMNLLAIVALSVEAWGYFDKLLREANPSIVVRNLLLAQQLSLSVIWAVYGGVLLTIGILRRRQLLRWMALLLLAVAIVKVCIFDVASLKDIYRVLSFAVLGGILLVVSILYQRLRRFLFDANETAQPATDESVESEV